MLVLESVDPSVRKTANQVQGMHGAFDPKWPTKRTQSNHFDSKHLYTIYMVNSNVSV